MPETKSDGVFLVGSIVIAVAILIGGLNLIGGVEEAYDAACEVQSRRGPCASIGNKAYLLTAIIWLAALCFPLAAHTLRRKWYEYRR